MQLPTFYRTHTIISLRILATDTQSVTIDVLETATCRSCSIRIDSYMYNKTVYSPAARTLQGTHPVSVTKASNSKCCYVQGDQKVFVTWWLQYIKLQVMLKVSPASLQTFIDTPNCVLEDRVQYTTVHTPNVFCDVHLQIVNCVGIVRIHWVCTVIFMCTEKFLSLCISPWQASYSYPILTKINKYRKILLKTINVKFPKNSSSGNLHNHSYYSFFYQFVLTSATFSSLCYHRVLSTRFKPKRLIHFIHFFCYKISRNGLKFSVSR
jgi:hypothetical protein